MHDLIMLYVTCADKNEAMTIGRGLIEHNLAACVNIIDSVTSIFPWENKVNESEEVILVGKTRSDNMNEVDKFIKKLHSYDIPCIVGIPIAYCDDNFASWVMNNC